MWLPGHCRPVQRKRLGEGGGRLQNYKITARCGHTDTMFQELGAEKLWILEHGLPIDL